MARVFPVHLTFGGGLDDSVHLVPFARRKAVQMANRLMDTGGSADSQRFVIDGMSVHVRAEIRGGEPILHAHIDDGTCFLHMDSGIADVISVAPKNPNKYANAKLYVGEALEKNTFWGQVSVPGGIGHTTIPVGEIGAEVVKSPPNTTGQEIECLQYVEPERPDGVSEAAWAETVEQMHFGLLGKKIRVAYSFSSYFSGKTRLYVQSVNSRRMFNETKPSPEFGLFEVSPPSLDIPMFDADGQQAMYPVVDPNALGRAKTLRIENSSLVSTGIYTDSNNHFWYVQLTNVGGAVAATITKMLLSPCGYAAAKRARKSATEEERTRFEALALSTGTPYNDVSFTVEDVCPIPDFTGPLCYGWTFKWDGSEAHIIVHNRTMSASFVAYHLKVNMHRDDALVFPEGSTLTELERERARWELTGGIIEGGSSWRSKSGLQNIWVPTFGGGGVLEWANTPDDVDCHGSAPLYCFYDRQDSLQVLRYNGNNAGAHDDQQYPSCYESQYEFSSGVPAGFTATRNVYTRDQSGSFTCGPISVHGRVAAASETSDNRAIAGGGFDANPGYTRAPFTSGPAGSPCASNVANLAYKAIIETVFPPGEPGYVAKWEVGIMTHTHDVGESTSNLYISVVIPWGDCAAVYLARKGTVVRNGDRIVYLNNSYVIQEESLRFQYNDVGVRVQFPGYAQYTYRNVDQSGTTTSTSSKYYENNPVADYLFIGFDGVGRPTQKGEWNDNLMNPSLRALEDQHTFSTFSSAGQADIIGSGFMTGGYALNDRGSNYSLMYNRAFIGFA